MKLLKLLCAINHDHCNHLKMTKKRCILYLLLLSFFLTECNTGSNKTNSTPFPPELVDFVPYENNPVFTGTGTDTWDRNIRERGYILKEDGMYRMWYTGYTSDTNATKYLGYATSPDGIHWTRYPGNPVFKEYWTEDMMVVKYGNKYFMVAEGVNDVAHMLTSANGIDWHRLGNLDIRKSNGESIDPGPYGTPTLWIENGKWYLFYERGDLGIWLAVSTDHRIWTNVQDEPVIKTGPGNYDTFGVALDQIIKYKGRYYGYYHGTPDKNWSSWNSNVAMSEDLVHWTKYEHNPIVNSDSLANDLSSPILVDDGTGYRLYTMHDGVRVYFHPEQSKILFNAFDLTKEGIFTNNCEGPAFYTDGKLYVVNFQKDGTIGMIDNQGNTSLFMELPEGSTGNGIRFDSRGNMLVADYTGHNVLKVDMNSKAVSVFAHSDHMNQPNDLAITSTNILFLSDPDWADSTGQLWRVDQEGRITLLEDHMGTTNGIEVAPGDSILYVNESVQRRIWSYHIDQKGNLSGKKLFYTFSDFGLDGMRCDQRGNLYVTRYGKGVVAILSPDGEMKREVPLTGKKCSNIAFGGWDAKTCFVTLQDRGCVETFRTDIPGRVFH